MPSSTIAGSRSLYQGLDPIATLDSTAKVALLGKVEKLARARDPRVAQVMAGLAGEYDVVMVARADGTLAADVRPLVRLSVTVIAEQKGRREMGSAGGGGRFGLAYFDDAQIENYVNEAVKAALTNLESRPAPAGEMTVVLGPGWPGILLHEAIGHGLEGDFNRKGTSAFAGLIGQRVAAPGVTVVDDGTMLNRRGSLSIDDEGTPTQENVLIEDGILRAYMQDRMNARLMGVKPTGNGRRQSHAYAPMPRMTNTFMLGGSEDPGTILSSVKKGIFAKSFGGGQVDITSGKFVFSASEAYLIEDGKLGAPVKGATLIGNGPDAMTKVSLIGNDSAMDPGIGTCGKDGQGVPTDTTAALEWFRKAAAQGQDMAQYQLGMAYQQGLWLPMNKVEAWAWFTLAATQWHTEAKASLQKLESELDSAQLYLARQRVADLQKTTPPMVPTSLRPASRYVVAAAAAGGHESSASSPGNPP